jgi:hypothetical protein
VTEQQWLKMYRETVHPLYGYMAKRTEGIRELTEDIVQESYLRTLDNWKRKSVPVRSIIRKTAGLLGTEWGRFLGCRKKKNDS